MEQSLYPGSQTFEQALCRLYLDQVITYDEALSAADSPTNLAWLVNQNTASTTRVDTGSDEEPAEDALSRDFVKLEIDPEFLNRP
jgi:twitching motility protein PilU